MIGKPFPKGYIPWNKGMKGKYSTNAGPESPRWKGGRRTIRGYIAVKMPNHPFAFIGGYILEHRLVMEKHLGRYLKPEEVIHHINLNKGDNRLENLQLFKKNGEHSIFSQGLKIECPHCLQIFVYKHK